MAAVKATPEQKKMIRKVAWRMSKRSFQLSGGDPKDKAAVMGHWSQNKVLFINMSWIAHRMHNPS